MIASRGETDRDSITFATSYPVSRGVFAVKAEAHRTFEPFECMIESFGMKCIEASPLIYSAQLLQLKWGRLIGADIHVFMNLQG